MQSKTKTFMSQLSRKTRFDETISRNDCVLAGPAVFQNIAKTNSRYPTSSLLQPARVTAPQDVREVRRLERLTPHNVGSWRRRRQDEPGDGCIHGTWLTSRAATASICPSNTLQIRSRGFKSAVC